MANTKTPPDDGMTHSGPRNWRSRKVWIPIVGLAIVLVGGYLAVSGFGIS